jgi:hypothetical protein
MVWAVVVVVVLALGTPVAGWWFARRPPPLDTADRGHGEIDRWLVEQFGLGGRERSRVRAAVMLGRPSSDPALADAARGLAAQVMADRFRTLRLGRKVGWFNLILGLAYAAFAIGVMIVGPWPGKWFLGVFGCFNGWVLSLIGVHHAFRNPRRIRHHAQLVLRSSRNTFGST